eukprot:1731207-Prorocentrum_lima.AAC.1
MARSVASPACPPGSRSVCRIKSLARQAACKSSSSRRLRMKKSSSLSSSFEAPFRKACVLSRTIL